MGYLRLFLGSVALLVTTLAVVGYLLPRERHITRSVTIAAPPSEIFAIVNSFEQLPQWSPWYELDPLAVYEFSGPEIGLGAAVTWRGDAAVVALGSMEITGVQSDRSVTTLLKLDAYPHGQAILGIEPRQRGSRVTYTFSSDAKRELLQRYLGVFLDGSLGKDLERGLANLRDFAEQRVADAEPTARAVPVLVVDLDSIPIIYVDASQTATFAEREVARLRAFDYLWQYAFDAEIAIEGPPLGTVTNDSSGRYGYRAALPVGSELMEVADGFGSGATYEGRAVRALYTGPYEGIGVAHAAAQAFLEREELEATEPAWERYVDDRQTTPAQQRQFEVYYPLD